MAESYRREEYEHNRTDTMDKTRREMLPQPNTHIPPLQFMPVARENKKKLRLGSTTANKDKIRCVIGFSTKLILGFSVVFFFLFSLANGKESVLLYNNCS
jgi:hypothetical protein